MSNQEYHIVIKKEEYEKLNHKITVLESKIFNIEKRIGIYHTPINFLLSSEEKNNILEEDKMTVFLALPTQQQTEAFHNMSQEERQHILHNLISNEKNKDRSEENAMFKDILTNTSDKPSERPITSIVYKKNNKLECEMIHVKSYRIKNVIAYIFNILNHYFESFLLYLFDFIIDIPAE